MRSSKRLSLILTVVIFACNAPIKAPSSLRSAANSSKPQMVHNPPIVPWRVGVGEPEDKGMLALINSYRAAAGVPLITLDRELTKGCTEHARYLVINRGKPEIYSTRAHVQVPTLPGATPAGAKCGRRANLYKKMDDLQHAVHDFMATIYHRRPILSPTLKSIGIGYASVPSSPFRAVALMFVSRSRTNSARWPVMYPADGQRGIPVDFVRESPNPIPPPTRYAGYPFTLQFPVSDEISNVTATFTDADDTPVPFWLSSPENPASKYSQQLGLVGVIPKQALKTSTTYTTRVTATWQNERQTWTSRWTTIGRRKVNATKHSALIAALGQPALVRGTILSSRKVSSLYGEVRFSLEAPARGSITRVLVFISHEHLGLRPIHELKGKTVEIESTPQWHFRYGVSKSIRLVVTPGHQIHILD